jgi:hypothetical protein
MSDPAKTYDAAAKMVRIFPVFFVAPIAHSGLEKPPPGKKTSDCYKVTNKTDTTREGVNTD